jgi:hypothetical protein
MSFVPLDSSVVDSPQRQVTVVDHFIEIEPSFGVPNSSTGLCVAPSIVYSGASTFVCPALIAALAEMP